MGSMRGPSARKLSFVGKRVHVIGLGAYGTGRELARVLASRGASVTVSDIKPAAELSGEIRALQGTGVAIRTGADAYRGMEQADLVIPSPGVPLDAPPLLHAAKHGAQVVSEIEVASWIAPCPIIAVSGTKGKSTTTSLIGELLKEEGKTVLLGGNIGRPLIGLADIAPPEALLVTEVSSFQLEATESFRPKVAVLLNVSPDHLDRHRTMAAYRAAKAKLFANQQPDDFAVVNREDPEAWDLAGLTRAAVLPFSVSRPLPEGADLSEGWLRVKGRPVCQAAQVRLRGTHNLANVLAALGAAEAAGGALERAAEVIAHFDGLEHRLETVDVIDGITFVNDSQATTPGAAVAALESFPGHVVLIAGGRAKVQDFSSLAEAAAKRAVDLVVIGEAAEAIATAAREAGAPSVQLAADLSEAVRRARQKARSGDVILLSPGCASFDMFSDMAERGRIFKDLVAEMAENKGAQ